MLVSFPYSGHAAAEGAGGGKEPESHSLSAALGGADFSCPSKASNQPLICRSGALQPPPHTALDAPQLDSNLFEGWGLLHKVLICF